MICETPRGRFERLTLINPINLPGYIEIAESLAAVKSSLSPSEWERFYLTRLGVAMETIDEYLKLSATFMERK